MDLQQLTLKKLLSFCGEKQFFSSLKAAHRFASEKDKDVLEFVIIYMNCFFDSKMDLENDLVELYPYAIECLETLSFYASKLNCETLDYFCSIVQDNLESVQKIKRIA